MDLEYFSKSSSSDETEQSSDDTTGVGRSYECIFCKRGFTTAQALGGHMNIHRKDRVANNKTNKPYFPPSTSSNNNYSHHVSVVPKVDIIVNNNNNNINNNNYHHHQVCFPTTTCGIIRPNYSHVSGHVFGEEQDYWRQGNLGLFANNPLCEIKEKFEENSEEDGVDLELRLGHHP